MPAFINGELANLTKSVLWVLEKSSMDNLSILTKSTLRGFPVQRKILGHTVCCGPKELKGSHIWIAIYRNSGWFALVSTLISGHNSCWVILADNSDSRWPRGWPGGAWPPRLQATALVTKITAQWELFPKHAWFVLMCHSGSRWPRCGQRVPDTQISALICSITTQWSIFWSLRVAWVTAPSQDSCLFCT